MSQWIGRSGEVVGPERTIHQEYLADSKVKNPANQPRIDLENIRGRNFLERRK